MTSALLCSTELKKSKLKRDFSGRKQNFLLLAKIRMVIIVNKVVSVEISPSNIESFCIDKIEGQLFDIHLKYQEKEIKVGDRTERVKGETYLSNIRVGRILVDFELEE